jgi:hypothetical protein
MKKILLIIIPIFLVVIYFTYGKSEPPKHGTVYYKTADGSPSFTEVYGAKGDLQEKTVYYKDGQVMLRITYRDGKEAQHDFYPKS